MQRPTLMTFLLIIVSIAGGILLSSQWRLKTVRVVNPIQPYTSLTETRDALNEEQIGLKEKIAAANKAIASRTAELTAQHKIGQSLSNQSAETMLVSGLVAVEGPGIVATLDDSQNGDLTEQAIAHAADLRDIVSILRAVGAEAISINGERIVATTAIDCIVNTILVNETRLANPFIVTAIGEVESMVGVLNDKSVLQNLHQRVEQDGIWWQVEKQDKVTVPAYTGSLPGSYAIVSL